MPEHIHVTSTVNSKYSNLRLDIYLSQRFTYLSRNAWQQEIKEARIQINNTTATTPHKKVFEGDIITYSGRDLEEPPVDKNFHILYEDSHYIAVNKPGNLPVHPGGRFLYNTLTMEIMKKNNIEVHPVHRIDRHTSGVILLAKSNDSVSLINKTFKNSKKEYLTIVKGIPDKKSFIIDTPLGPDYESKVRKKRAAYPGAPESALTQFKVIKTMKSHTLLKAVLVTGRLHQIRAHLESVNLPILGDKLYGGNDQHYLEFIEKGEDPDLLKKVGFVRCALHSRALFFYHPYLKQNIRILAPLHDDMKDFLIMHSY